MFPTNNLNIPLISSHYKLQTGSSPALKIDWFRQNEIQPAFRGKMQIVAAGGQDGSRTSSASDRGACRRALPSACDRANDSSNACATTDHGGVTLLVVLGNTHEGLGFDRDGLSVVLTEVN